MKHIGGGWVWKGREGGDENRRMKIFKQIL